MHDYNTLYGKVKKNFKLVNYLMPPLHYGPAWPNSSQPHCVEGRLAYMGKYWLTLAMRLAIVGLRGGFFDTPKRANVAKVRTA